MIDYHQVPIANLNLIKKGADFITAEGKVIPNDVLTTPADKTISYAYCSDTAYFEKIIPLISGVDLLYHEATFAESEKSRAKTTMHSTAAQAAAIARKANVSRLILGHFSARYNNQQVLLDEARVIFENTVLAEDMTVFEI